MPKLPKSDAETEGDDLYASPPVQRAARLLRYIAEGDAVTNMSETARALGINRTTLVRLLHTLSAERFIEPRPGGNGWRIGVDGNMAGQCQQWCRHHSVSFCHRRNERSRRRTLLQRR